MKKILKKIIWFLLGVIYFPIFLLGIIIAYAARIALIIGYLLMCDFKQARNIFIFTFKPFNYGKDYSKRF